MERKVLVAAMMVLLCVLSACGRQVESVEPAISETETITVQTGATTENSRTAPVETEETVFSEDATTTIAETTTMEVTEAPVRYMPSDEEVAEKMHVYFSDKGYSDAQIAGIIGNAEAESGLNPLRFVSDEDFSWFGLFMLVNCPRRDEMFAEFEAQGVDKYTAPEYWNNREFDSVEDFDKFMTILLDYTMDSADSTWMEEIKNTDNPEEAAEIFLVWYERAFGGDGEIELYEPFKGQAYQGVSRRRELSRRWYEYFVAV